MAEFERILTGCKKTKAKAIRENRIALWEKEDEKLNGKCHTHACKERPHWSTGHVVEYHSQTHREPLSCLKLQINVKPPL